MSTLAVVVIAIGALLVLLAVGGAIATARRHRADAAAFAADLEEVNRQLAAAHAQDNGWDPAALEEAARAAWAEARPGTPIDELVLVQIVDPPGTEADKAVFRITSGGRVSGLTLGRRDGRWVGEDLS